MTFEEAEKDFYKTQELWMIESEEKNDQEESWEKIKTTRQDAVRNDLQ